VVREHTEIVLDPVPMSELRAAWTKGTIAAAVGISALGAAVLHLMGRRVWCACGSPVPWSWDIWSPHNSQHLIDPYTFTHVLQGVLCYALLRMVLGARWPAARTLLAVTAEVAWEIIENTNTVIAHYRDTTIALNYVGDSILNSLGDIGGFVLGYTAVMCVPVWISVAGFAAVEGALLLTIRDGLLLNILMLLHPIQAIKVWQMGG